jgi:hypothetical protein
MRVHSGCLCVYWFCGTLLNLESYHQEFDIISRLIAFEICLNCFAIGKKQHVTVKQHSTSPYTEHKPSFTKKKRSSQRSSGHPLALSLRGRSLPICGWPTSEEIIVLLAESSIIQTPSISAHTRKEEGAASVHLPWVPVQPGMRQKRLQRRCTSRR